MKRPRPDRTKKARTRSISSGNKTQIAAMALVTAAFPKPQRYHDAVGIVEGQDECASDHWSGTENHVSIPSVARTARNSDLKFDLMK